MHYISVLIFLNNFLLIFDKGMALTEIVYTVYEIWNQFDFQCDLQAPEVNSYMGNSFSAETMVVYNNTISR